MGSGVRIGKKEITEAEVMPLLSGYNLWPQLMQGIVVDSFLREYDCSFSEIEDYYRTQIIADSEFLEKQKTKMLCEGAGSDNIDFFLKRPILLEKFKQRVFGPLVEGAFLAMKSGLDKVVFFMIRNRDHELIRELFFRLESGEDVFSVLAARYSEGRESKSEGKIGPVELKQLNPALASLLATTQIGVLNPPVVIDGYGVICLLKEKIPARLDEVTKRNLLNRLFEEWLAKEVNAFFY